MGDGSMEAGTIGDESMAPGSDGSMAPGRMCDGSMEAGRISMEADRMDAGNFLGAVIHSLP
jgi:hypothetical protein